MKTLQFKGVYRPDPSPIVEALRVLGYQISPMEALQAWRE